MVTESTVRQALKGVTGGQYDTSLAEETAQRIGVLFLGRLPIVPEIARLCDTGRIEEYTATAFAPIARELAARLPGARLSSFSPL